MYLSAIEVMQSCICDPVRTIMATVLKRAFRLSGSSLRPAYLVQARRWQIGEGVCFWLSAKTHAKEQIKGATQANAVQS